MGLTLTATTLLQPAQGRDRKIHHQSSIHIVSAVYVDRRKHDRHTAGSGDPFRYASPMKVNHATVIEVSCCDNQGKL